MLKQELPNIVYSKQNIAILDQEYVMMLDFQNIQCFWLQNMIVKYCVFHLILLLEPENYIGIYYRERELQIAKHLQECVPALETLKSQNYFKAGLILALYLHGEKSQLILKLMKILYMRILIYCRYRNVENNLSIKAKKGMIFIRLEIIYVEWIIFEVLRRKWAVTINLICGR